MDPETKNLLQKTLALTEENNVILKKMRKNAAWGRAFHWFYIIVILALSFGSFYYVQPYLNQILSVYSGAQSSLDGFKNAFK